MTYELDLLRHEFGHVTFSEHGFCYVNYSQLIWPGC